MITSTEKSNRDEKDLKASSWEASEGHPAVCCILEYVSSRHWTETLFSVRETGDCVLNSAAQPDAIQQADVAVRQAGPGLSRAAWPASQATFCGHSNAMGTISDTVKRRTKPKLILLHRSNTVWRNKKGEKVEKTYFPHICLPNTRIDSDFDTAKSRELTWSRILMFSLTITYYTPACISFSSSYENMHLKM